MLLLFILFIVLFALIPAPTIGQDRNSIELAMSRCDYTPLPYYYGPNEKLYSPSNYAISRKDIYFDLYYDLQYSQPISSKDIDDSPDLYAKIKLRKNTLCLFHQWGFEFGCLYLAIVNDNGIVLDKLFAGLYGLNIIARQFSVIEESEIKIYYFVPDSSNIISIEECDTNPSVLDGRICIESYSITNEYFSLKNREFSPHVRLDLKMHYHNRINLWNLYKGL